MFEHILSGLSMVFALDNMAWSFFGVFIGMIMGAIPGLTDNMAVVLLLPFTFYLNPIAGIAMLMGLAKGGNFGGSIPAILLNIPGTPQAMCTCLDGYPLTRQGKSGKALKTALWASCSADFLSDLVLIFLAAPVAMIALKVGPAEYSMIILFSLIVISIAATDEPLRGVVATGLGLLLSTVGLDPMIGTPRFMFGVVELSEGFQVMPMVIGMLAFSEIMLQIEQRFKAQPAALSCLQSAAGETPPATSNDPANNRLTFREFRGSLRTLFRSTAIGSVIGIIPGIGTTVGSYLSYIAAKRGSRKPEEFGHGSLEGIVASEAGNNAVNGPNLVPLVTLGIPGNLAAALILGGFMIKGLIPGPMFMEHNAPMMYALFTVLLISNVFTFIIGSGFIRYARHLTRLPKTTLFAAVLVFSIVGAYVFNSNLFDVYVMFVFGIVGYILTKCRINLPVLIVSFFLGELFERRTRQALTIADFDFTIFLTKPICLAFAVLTVVVATLLLRSKRHLKGME